MSFWAKYAGIFGGGGGGGGGGGNAPVGNIVSLSSGVSSQSVTFAAEFSGTPFVLAFLTSSNTSAAIIPVISVSVTDAGFTAKLGTATPDNTYSLNWIAGVANG